MLAGMAMKTARANTTSLTESCRMARRFQNTATICSRQAQGIRILNAAAPIMVIRYFSAYSTQRISRKYSVKSASLPAIGVAVSPGIAEMPAEATVDAAVSLSTVSAFSLMDA